MKKSVVMLMGAALLLSFSASAKVTVSKYSITINEPVTETNFAAAWAECQKKGGKTPSVTLMKCSDPGVAAVIKIYPGISSLTIQDSPELKSITVLGTTKLKTLNLKNLKSLSDLSQIGRIKTLQQLKIEKVNFTNKDLSFCAGLSNLSSFELAYAPASLKTIAGIEKCTKISNLNIRSNLGPLDLAPLANFTKVRRINLSYMNGIDLAPVAKMASLTDLSLYGSKNIDLAPLAACPKLKTIMIYATKGVKDYNALGNIKTLEFVNAGLTPMNDLSWAPKLPNLKKLSLFAETYKTFAPLAQCRKLEDLTFWSMRQTVDIAQFADGAAPLKRLSFAGSAIANEAKLAALGKSGKLVELNLSEIARGKQVVDISFLASLPTVKKLYIQKTKVASLDPLFKMPGLKELTVDKATKPQVEGKLNGVKIRAW